MSSLIFPVLCVIAAIFLPRLIPKTKAVLKETADGKTSKEEVAQMVA